MLNGAGMAFVGFTMAPSAASAVDLIKKLDCALTQTTHSGGSYCLKVYNTCDTPIVSRIEKEGGVEMDGPEVRTGDRGKVCSPTPFVFLGHYLTGPGFN